MNRRARDEERTERSPVPLLTAIVGLGAAVASFAIRDENLSATIFGSGLITAGGCILYWLANPTREDE